MAIMESWNFESGTYTGTNGTEIRVSGVSSPGAYRNASGLLEYPAANNLPRIDYDENGTCLGLLIEEAKTERTSDLRDQRSQYTSGLNSWNSNLSLSTENAETDPFGVANNSDEFHDYNDSTLDNVYIFTTQSYGNATYYCTSVFVKALNAATRWVYLRQFFGAVGLGWFDIKNGVLGSTSGANVLTSGMEGYANGWYRIWLVTLSSGTSTGTVRIGLTDIDGGSSYITTGMSIATDCYQTEIMVNTADGNRHPSSFCEGNRDDEEVITNGVTWYTDPDALSFATAWFPNYGSGGQSASHNYTFQLTTGDVNSYVRAGEISGDYRLEWLNNPGTDATLTCTNPLNDDGTTEYFAGTVASNDGYVNCNGVTASTSSVTAPLSDAVTKACVGWRDSASTQLNGHMKYLAFWDERLDNATIDTYGTTGYTFPTSFPGNIAGDGGHVWPARANDPRWTQIITDSGITATGNFQDDVKRALIALSGASGGSPDDLWKKVKAANGVTDTSEPWLY